jgi:hypothetical protein
VKGIYTLDLCSSGRDIRDRYCNSRLGCVSEEFPVSLSQEGEFESKNLRRVVTNIPKSDTVIFAFTESTCYLVFEREGYVDTFTFRYIIACTLKDLRETRRLQMSNE